jgi:hypothetical protein
METPDNDGMMVSPLNGNIIPDCRVRPPCECGHGFETHRNNFGRLDTCHVRIGFKIHEEILCSCKKYKKCQDEQFEKWKTESKINFNKYMNGEV